MSTPQAAPATPARPTKTAVTIDELADRVRGGYESYLTQSWRARQDLAGGGHAWASGIAHECLVRQVLDIKRPSAAQQPDLTTRGLFWTGKQTELDVTMALLGTGNRHGFELAGVQEYLQLTQQIPNTQLHVPILTGRLDLRVQVAREEVLIDDEAGATFGAAGLPVEVKGIHGEVWERLEEGNLDQLVERYSYARGWLDQCQAYTVMGNDIPAVLLFIVSKQHRLAKMYVVRRHDEWASGITRKALDIFLLAQLPLEEVLPQAVYLHAECPRCPYFRGICPVRGLDPKVDIQRPEIRARVLELLNQQDALKPGLAQMKELEKLGKPLKEELKALLEGVEKVELEDGTVVRGSRIEVSPSDGYSYWKWSAKRPKVVKL